MARVIGKNVVNTLTIRDPLNSGQPIRLYFRTPTTEERVAYKLAQFERTEGQIRSRVTETRHEYGAKILLGIGEGDLQFKDEDGSTRGISSGPQSADYLPEWKECLQAYAADLLEFLAEHVFEGTMVMATQAETFKGKN